MSAKTRRPTPTEKLVRVKDLFPVLKAINLLQDRVKELEKAKEQVLVVPSANPSEWKDGEVYVAPKESA